MLSPSDFNNAVPQFTNGNYASNPINPQYVAEPDAENYNRGTEPLQTLPAQWWNWFINKFTARFNKVNIYVKNIFNELAQVLSIFNITPNGTEQTPTTSQLKTVFECCYPQYVKNDLYGNIAGTALGVAAVGTATTFARSDHVHPIPTCVSCSGLATAATNLKTFDGYQNPSNTKFNWVGYEGTPTYLWGANAQADTNLYCPSCFHVACADKVKIDTTGSTDYLNLLMAGPDSFYEGLIGSAHNVQFNQNTGDLRAVSFTGTLNGCACTAGHAENTVYVQTFDGYQNPSNTKFNWVGYEGTPTYLWGANAQADTNLYCPSCFHVACADKVKIDTTGSTDYLNLLMAGPDSFYNGLIGASHNVQFNQNTGDLKAVSFTGNLNGCATNATNDSDGNAINTTYAKKANFSYNNGVLTITM